MAYNAIDRELIRLRDEAGGYKGLLKKLVRGAGRGVQRLLPKRLPALLTVTSMGKPKSTPPVDRSKLSMGDDSERRLKNLTYFLRGMPNPAGKVRKSSTVEMGSWRK